MANMPSTNKRFMSVLMPLELVAQLRREAAARKMTLTELVCWLLDRELQNVELTADDYQWITDQVRKNEQKRKGKAK